MADEPLVQVSSKPVTIVARCDYCGIVLVHRVIQVTEHYITTPPEAAAHIQQFPPDAQSRHTITITATYESVYTGGE